MTNHAIAPLPDPATPQTPPVPPLVLLAADDALVCVDDVCVTLPGDRTAADDDAATESDR